MIGNVKMVVPHKGYGFIIGENGKEYFFHSNDMTGYIGDIAEDLKKGLVVKVEFEPTPSSKGLRASDIRLL